MDSGFNGWKSYPVWRERKGESAWVRRVRRSPRERERVNWHVHESPSRLAASPRIERGRALFEVRNDFDRGRMRGRERERFGGGAEASVCGEGAKRKLELELRSTLLKVSRGRMLGD